MSEARPSILIADDSPTNRLALRRMLHDVPAEVLETSNGLEALQVAQQREVAVVLLDVEMPGLDGFETIQAMRRLPSMQTTPVILVSAARVEDHHRRRAYDLGAVDYLINKPVEPEMLRQKVRVFLDMYRRRLELQHMLGRMQVENEKLFTENEHFRATRSALLYQATHDVLTGLPNRALLDDRLKAAIERSRRANRSFGVVYIDLDAFKQVNDNYGHAVGDALLSETARRLVRTVRASDTVARLGGDEFVLVLEGLDNDARALALCREVIDAIQAPLSLPMPQGSAAVELRPVASVGVALFPGDADDPEGLLVLSDLAMYDAKRSGGGLRAYADVNR